ncbi:hypothetical protein D3C71_854860 [compost metagenome]
MCTLQPCQRSVIELLARIGLRACLRGLDQHARFVRCQCCGAVEGIGRSGGIAELGLRAAQQRPAIGALRVTLQRLLQCFYAVTQGGDRRRGLHLCSARIADQQVQAGAGHAERYHPQHETAAALLTQRPQHYCRQQRSGHCGDHRQPVRHQSSPSVGFTATDASICRLRRRTMPITTSAPPPSTSSGPPHNSQVPGCSGG